MASHNYCKKSYDQLRQHIKKKRHYFADKGPPNQGYGFSCSHVWLWELDYKESWELKNWCFWAVVLEKMLESPLDCKEIQPVHPKGNQSWIFIGRTDAEAETPILWPPDVRNWLTGKDTDAGRLMAGGEGDDRGWDGWMASPTQWIWVWASSGNWWWDREVWCAVFRGVAKSQTWLSDWTELQMFRQWWDYSLSRIWGWGRYVSDGRFNMWLSGFLPTRNFFSFNLKKIEK